MRTYPGGKLKDNLDANTKKVTNAGDPSADQDYATKKWTSDNSLTGPTGPTGTGVTGPTGPSGTGPTGPTGETGTGVTGSTGPTGTGVTGPTGPSGTGPTGPTGETGTGVTGSTGPTGTGVTGPTGPSGTGPTGPTGATGTGTTGPTGPTGPTGGTTRNPSIIINGGGSAITTGPQGGFRCPISGHITGYEIQSMDNTAGAIAVAIWIEPYAGGVPVDADEVDIAVITATNTQGTESGLEIDVTAGDWIAFNVDSITDLKLVSLALIITEV